MIKPRNSLRETDEGLLNFQKGGDRFLKKHFITSRIKCYANRVIYSLLRKKQAEKCWFHVCFMVFSESLYQKYLDIW